MWSKLYNIFDIRLLKRVFKYIIPYKTKFWTTSFLTISLAVIAPLRPWMIQFALDSYVSIPDLDGLTKITILLIALLILEAFIQFYQTYAANWLGQMILKDLRENVYQKITHFKLKYFDRNPIGMLVTRAVSDIETIAEIFSQGLLIIIGDLLKLIVVIVVMFATDWKLALFSLSSLPLLIIATNVFKNAIKSSFQDVRTQVAKLNTFVQEHITGMSVVQIFGREKIEMERFQQINAIHRDAHIKSVWAYSIFFPVVEILSALSIAFLVWWGSIEVITSEVSFGTLVAFLLYIHMMFRPIRQLADRFNTLQMGMVSSERVFKILDSNEQIVNEGTIILPHEIGEIEFKKVWFAYNDENWIIKDVSFKINKGETLAIVGATGAGKSSLISILARFYDYNKGDILINNQTIRDFTLPSLRKNIGVVLQDVFLFSDTVLNNITLNNKSITEKQVIEVAKIVGVHDFIMQLPNGYHYDVKERGNTLSVGQRQLISFIRAYLYNPAVLILDEATSSIDTASEELIQFALKKLTENRTSIIIAHRLATIQNADKILVMDLGEIKEYGTHQELMNKNGFYKKLFNLQFDNAA